MKIANVNGVVFGLDTAANVWTLPATLLGTRHGWRSLRIECCDEQFQMATSRTNSAVASSMWRLRVTRLQQRVYRVNWTFERSKTAEAMQGTMKTTMPTKRPSSR